MNPKISVVVVSWNALGVLKKCLEALEREADLAYELLVTDNGSIDNTAEFLNQYRPQNSNCVRYECTLNGKDHGFSVAANQGMRKAKGDYILLLASSTEIMPKTLSGLSSIAEKYPNMGMMGANMIYPDGRRQHCVSRLPSISNIIFSRLKLNKKFPNNQLIKKTCEMRTDENTESVVESIRGALMFISAKAVKKIGLLDEKFFLWFEETDYCKRIRDAGLDVMYAPSINTIHRSEASISGMKIRERLLIYNKSLRRYFRKHHGLFFSIVAGIVDPLCLLIAPIICRKK